MLFFCPLLGWVLVWPNECWRRPPTPSCRMHDWHRVWMVWRIDFFIKKLAYLLLLYSTILCSQADSLHLSHAILKCSFLLCVFEYPSKWCTYSAILAGCGLYHLKDFCTDCVAFPLAEVFKLHQEWQQTEHGCVSCVLGEYRAAWCCNYRQLTLFFVPGVVTVGSWWCFLSQEL